LNKTKQILKNKQNRKHQKPLLFYQYCKNKNRLKIRRQFFCLFEEGDSFSYKSKINHFLEQNILNQHYNDFGFFQILHPLLLLEILLLLVEISLAWKAEG